MAMKVRTVTLDDQVKFTELLQDQMRQLAVETPLDELNTTIKGA